MLSKTKKKTFKLTNIFKCDVFQANWIERIHFRTHKQQRHQHFEFHFNSEDSVERFTEHLQNRFLFS